MRASPTTGQAGHVVRIHHRVKGRPAIVRSLRSLLIRVHRFGRARATTPADRMWTARMIDALTAALDVDAREEKAEGSR